MHTVRGGLRALPAIFGIFRGKGWGDNSAQGFLYFCGRDVGAVTPAESLAKIKMQGCGQGCRQV